jgi:predicted kinase
MTVFSPSCLELRTQSAIGLILLIGLPGSGKSTLAARLQRQSDQRQLISTDAIRAHLFGDEAIQGPWLQVWREVGCQFRSSVQQILSGQMAEAIYDATNVVRKQRRQAIALARRSGFTHITGIWLNPALEVCLARNHQRDRQVPEAVILQMHRRLWGAPPAIADGFEVLIEVGDRDGELELAERLLTLAVRQSRLCN